MPTKKAAAKAGPSKGRVKKTPKDDRKKYNKRNMVILVSSIVAGLLLFLIVMQTGVAMNPQAKMAKYLNDKYKEEFVVEKASIVSDSIGSTSYGAKAHPIKDTSQDFSVTMTKVALSNSFGDTYLRTLWTKKYAPAIEQEINAIPGRAASVEVNVSLSPDYTIKNEVSDFDKLSKESNRRISMNMTIKETRPYSAEVLGENTQYISKILAKYASNKAYALYIDYIGKTESGDGTYGGHLYNVTNVLSSDEIAAKIAPEQAKEK